MRTDYPDYEREFSHSIDYEEAINQLQDNYNKLAEYSQELERQYNEIENLMNGSSIDTSEENGENLTTLYDWDYSNAIQEEEESAIDLNAVQNEDETYANLLNKHAKQFMI